MFKLRKRWGNRITIRLVIPLNLVATLTACHAQHSETSIGDKRSDDYTLLGLVGYNYTDRHISAYSVDGADGGHINLSSPTSGGSGVSCCVKFSKTNSKPIRIKVRWQVDGCTHLIKDDTTGKTDRVRYYYYREAEVEAQRAYRVEPNYIETHFFPNGLVEVRLTEQGSDPLLNLSDRRQDRSYFPKCKDDRKPDE